MTIWRLVWEEGEYKDTLRDFKWRAVPSVRRSFSTFFSILCQPASRTNTPVSRVAYAGATVIFAHLHIFETLLLLASVLAQYASSQIGTPTFTYLHLLAPTCTYLHRLPTPDTRHPGWSISKRSSYRCRAPIPTPPPSSSVIPSLVLQKLSALRN